MTTKELRMLYKAQTGFYPGKPVTRGSNPSVILELEYQNKQGLLDYITWLEDVLINNKIKET